MDSNEERIQKHLVIDSPGQRSEVLTERTESGPRASRFSGGVIALITVIAISVAAIVVFLVVNRNANEAANRNANLEAANQTNSHQPTTIVQQPAAQPAPVIIQQPAGAQQQPVIIQQPAEPAQRQSTSANDDAAMQDIATKKLIEDPNMTGVLMTITDARVVLTGTVSTAADKAKAEQIVKGVRGVKSVDNQIVISG